MQVVRYAANGAVAPISSLIVSKDDSPEVREELIGVSRWSEMARMLVACHAEHDSPLILEGEPGTGKRHLARLIHRSSARREGPFVALALGSADEAVARAALFGSTNLRSDDARREKGLADLVADGTLYIEGFAAISPALAADIIRLAEREGSSCDGARKPRVLLSGNLQNEADANAIVRATASLGCDRIHLLPLRERPEDIEALAGHFIRELCEQRGKEFRRVSPEAMQALQSFDWPRNVTELRTLINQLVQQSGPPAIDVAHLPAYLAGPARAKRILPDSGVDLENEVRRVEVDLICAALRQSRGLQNKAAQLLRVKPTTLFMKIRRLGIDVGAFR